MHTGKQGDNDWRSGFEFADALAHSKTDTLIQNGSDTLAVILDWDGVVATKGPDGVSGTTWSILKRHMSQENQSRHSQLYTHFRPLEKSGQLTVEGAEFWQRQALELLIGSPIAEIEADAQEHISLRQGMKQLFETCQDAGVPIFINSAGERHVIEAVTRHHGLRPSHIFSNDFTIDGGIITGVHEHSLTHNLNKHTHSHRTTGGHESRSTTIVVGDNLHDAHMIGLDIDDLTLRIRMDVAKNEYIGLLGVPIWEHYLRDSFQAGYDLVATDPDSHAIVALVAAVIARN